MSYDRFTRMINNLDLLRKKQLDIKDHKKTIDNFINEFGLLDFREFRQAPLQNA
jgi:ureidoacrylate peracid hydrolase